MKVIIECGGEQFTLSFTNRARPSVSARPDPTEHQVEEIRKILATLGFVTNLRGIRNLYGDILDLAAETEHRLLRSVACGGYTTRMDIVICPDCGGRVSELSGDVWGCDTCDYRRVEGVREDE